jgi:hypothetical protein
VVSQVSSLILHSVGGPVLILVGGGALLVLRVRPWLGFQAGLGLVGMGKSQLQFGKPDATISKAPRALVVAHLSCESSQLFNGIADKGEQKSQDPFKVLRTYEH